MTDVFLSYSREDQPTARRFADGLKREGFSVWWDQALSAGEAFDRVTEKALDEARAVVVLWSKHSVDSNWVRAEATQAQVNHRLVPVMIEPCKRPIMFELTHTAELAQWKGDTSDPLWRSFVTDLRRFVGEGNGQRAPAPAVPPPRARRKVVVWTAVVALATIAAGLFWLQQGHRSHASVADQPLRLAVLPFTSMSTDAAYGFFADGLHEEVLTALSQQAPGLELISRTTMMTYRQNPKPVTAIAAELGVTHVLEASVRREPDHVRLTVQLIDARSDRHLWSQNYDRTAQESLGLQTEIARAVATQLAARLVQTEEIAPATRDTEAYDLYLRAKTIMGADMFLQPPADAQAITLLDQAIARDQGFALAYLQRARARLFILNAGRNSSDELVQAVRADIDRAHELAPDEPQVRWAESFYAVMVEGDMTHALREIDAAMASGISDPVWSRARAAVLVLLGRKAEALEICRRLVDLDPGDPLTLIQCAWRNATAREPGEALRYYDLAIARDPDNLRLRIERASVLYDYTGRLDALQALAQGIGANVPGFSGFVHQQQLFLNGRHKEFLAAESEVPAGAPSPLLWNLRLRRGDAALLLGDRRRAATEGQVALVLLKPGEQQPWNQVFVRSIRAQIHLQAGRCDSADKDSRAALELAPQDTHGYLWMQAASVRAKIAAWCGQPDEALTLLETLSTSIPGLSPAEIALNAMYTTKLAGQPRFQALKSRLEQQMHNTHLE